MAAIEIVRIPVLSDNYVWMAHDPASGETVVIDPAVADPVLEAAAARGWHIDAIWNTHWHPDHTGGNAAIKQATGATVIAPAAEAERIPTLDRAVGEDDRVRLGDHEAVVLEVPAHTAGHIAYLMKDQDTIFVGDTLFAMGCGRLFEGTAEQMFANMQRFRNLPSETRVYCAHEYTLSNARFAAHADPGNAAISERLIEVTAMRDAGQATVPTSIGRELETNPFMRSADVAELARLRTAKDGFKG